MHFKYSFLMVILLFTSTQIFANKPQWKLVSKSDLAAVYIDLNSIVGTTDAPYRKSNSKTVYLRNGQYKIGDYYITNDFYDCENATTDFITKNIYSKNGKLIETYKNELISPIDIQEGTLIERLFRVTCTIDLS